MSQKTYHISNPIQFLAMTWPVPAGSLIFWSQRGAGGVLLFLDVHYIQSTEGNYAFDLELEAGDLISVVTFGAAAGASETVVV
jgi:hypothetical protein